MNNTIVAKAKTGKKAQKAVEAIEPVVQVKPAIQPPTMDANGYPVCDWADDRKLSAQPFSTKFHYARFKSKKSGLQMVIIKLGDGLNHQMMITSGKNGVQVRVSMVEYQQTKVVTNTVSM